MGVMSRNFGAKRSLSVAGISWPEPHMEAPESPRQGRWTKVPNGKGDIICSRKQKSLVTYLRTSCKMKKI